MNGSGRGGGGPGGGAVAAVTGGVAREVGEKKKKKRKKVGYYTTSSRPVFFPLSSTLFVARRRDLGGKAGYMLAAQIALSLLLIASPCVCKVS